MLDDGIPAWEQRSDAASHHLTYLKVLAIQEPRGLRRTVEPSATANPEASTAPPTTTTTNANAGKTRALVVPFYFPGEVREVDFEPSESAGAKRETLREDNQTTGDVAS